MQKNNPEKALSTNKDWLEEFSKFGLDSRGLMPAVIERGEGCRVWDVEGKEYLDLMSGQLCVSVGHGHPELLEAVRRHSERLMQTGSSVVTPEEVALARKLEELTPGDLGKSSFGCTGSEANETALRMAKFYTGRQEVVALADSYHGLSFAAWSVTGRGYRRGHPDYGAGMPGVTFLPAPNPYRCHFCKGKSRCDLTCFDYSTDLLDRTTSGSPAAFIIEPVMGGQIVVPPQEYMSAMRDFCTQRGTLLIIDECLTGLGRTGRWFASDHFGVVPDIMVLAKSLGGAVPLSAVVVKKAIGEALESRGYVQTSSHVGDPFLCGVGLANLEIMERYEMVGNAQRMGDYFKAGLEDLKEQYEVVGDVRGLGLLLGVELVKDKESRAPALELASTVEHRCLELGLILFITSRDTSVIRIAPPLVITRAEVDSALSILEEALQYAVERSG